MQDSNRAFKMLPEWVPLLSMEHENFSASVSDSHDLNIGLNNDKPATVAARSKAWSVFARSNTVIVSSNPTQSIDVCLLLFCVCSP
jgi:hypothetical protein